MMSLFDTVNHPFRRRVRLFLAPALRVSACSVLLSCVWPGCVFGADTVSSDLQERTLKLEQKQFELALERYDTDNKHHEQEQKTIHEAIVVAAVLGGLGAAIALLCTWQSKRERDTQVKLKAAEILFNTDSAGSFKTKGRVLSSLFPQELRRFGLAARDYASTDAPGRRELFRLFAANPQSHKEILEVYAVLFPEVQPDLDLVSRIIKTVPDTNR